MRISIALFVFFVSFGFAAAQVGSLPISDSDADKAFKKLMAVSSKGEIAARKAQQVIERLAAKAYGGDAPDLFLMCRVLEYLEEAMRRYADRQGNRDGHTDADEWQAVQEQLPHKPGLQVFYQMQAECKR